MPSDRQLTAHVYHTATRSLCPHCTSPVDARVWSRDGSVLFRRRCPKHGVDEVAVCHDAAWYFDALSFASVLALPDMTRHIDAGCPRDCGPCEAHLQRFRVVHLERSAPAAYCIPADAPAVVAQHNATSPLTDQLRTWGRGSEDSPDTFVLEAEGVTVPELVRALVEASGGALEAQDFVPSPWAHPHCVALCPVVRSRQGIVPIARQVGRRALFERLASQGATVGEPGDVAPMPALDHTETTIPPVQHGTIVAHAMMTPERFDLGRAMRCPYGVAGEHALTIAPACVPRDWVDPRAGAGT